MEAVISNCCNNFGPGQFPEKLIPKLIFNILNNKPLPIYGKGLNTREWIHVEDHVDGLLHLSKNGKVGESYCIGSGEEYSNRGHFDYRWEDGKIVELLAYFSEYPESTETAAYAASQE